MQIREMDEPLSILNAFLYLSYPLSLEQTFPTAKRLPLLPDILSEYQKLLAKKNKLNNVLITTAFELSEAQEEQLDGLLKKRYGKNLSTKVEVNKDLIGGLTIKSGDEVIDLSTKGKLLKLKKQIS